MVEIMAIVEFKSREMVLVRKGMFSIDASFAVVILLLMSYLFFMILDSLNSSFGLLQQRQKTVSLIVFSDELVRREAAVSTNTEVISNKISVEELEDYFTNNLMKSNSSSYGFDKIRVSVIGEGGVVYFDREVIFRVSSSSDVFCINRLIVISGTGESGIMRVCAS